MQNSPSMTDKFESEKNLKATGYTAVICSLLLILLLYISWTQPVIVPPVVEEGIEVNLGNSDQGLGTNQPYLPGKPSAQDKEKYTPPKQAVVEKEPVKDVETDDNNKEEAPVVKKAVVTKPNATKIPDKEIVKKAVKPVKVPETMPTPPKPRPKAVFHGTSGTGTGGNEADDYKPGGNQGVAGGRGDQGKPGGDPNSTNYTGGGHGNSGVSISRGLSGRHITGTPSFTDDFNENAKVAVDIHVDANGNVTEADYQPRGSTTSDASMKAIAKRKAMQVKFNSGGDESIGTIIFNFKIHN
jgi:outer membrane biosynthesis protein TonB